jgi:hypothetical protein
MKSAVQKILKEVSGKLSFSLDIWTSTVVKAYIGITVHFINNSWNLQQITLDFIELEGSHTGKCIAEELIAVLSSYDISKKVK